MNTLVDMRDLWLYWISLIARIAVPVDLAHDPRNSYGYVPTKSVCITFIILFTLAAVIHTAQSFYWRMRWLLPTAALCGLSEVVGWSARLWSSINPLNKNAFIMQMSVTIMAPTPLVAALFLCFELISERLGTQYGRLPPKWYSRIFLACDFISLNAQGIGGGLAGSADGDQHQLNLGSNIMLGGIVFQLASISVFVALMVEYFIRYAADRPVRKSKSPSAAQSSFALCRGAIDAHMQLMVLGVCLDSLFLFIRSVYRTVELVNGFDGPIIQTQVYFNVLDGGMVVLAIYTLAILHPGWLLAGQKHPAYACESGIKESDSMHRKSLLMHSHSPYRD
ncbi:RTA1-domain-containing protein [Epithele typhae]|uniref:RTA1-domain-containing protein n=1 Tax=Epithele typhae TaxID=378194 RepID=UPI002007BFFC|nr:RTA1-domain-containing protein [Epithele typhae]KAH9944343.1 RTA1-domain-containing protein [Epithele typhae]